MNTSRNCFGDNDWIQKEETSKICDETSEAQIGKINKEKEHENPTRFVDINEKAGSMGMQEDFELKQNIEKLKKKLLFRVC